MCDQFLLIGAIFGGHAGGDLWGRSPHIRKFSTGPGTGLVTTDVLITHEVEFVGIG